MAVRLRARPIFLRRRHGEVDDDEDVGDDDEDEGEEPVDETALEEEELRRDARGVDERERDMEDEE